MNDPELMRTWGALNAEWDEIEHLLYQAFDSMLEDDEGATGAIFYSQKSHAARRDMVEYLAEYFFRDNPEQYRPLKNAIKWVKARSDDRHALAHGSWMAYLKPGEPLQIGRIPRKPHLIDSLNAMYSKADLERVVQEMRDTATALSEAVAPLRKRRMAFTAAKRGSLPDEGGFMPVPEPVGYKRAKPGRLWHKHKDTEPESNG